MASKRFEIDMGLNASDVAKGAKDAETAIGKLEDAVEDAGRARDLDRLEDSLRDVQRQAGRTEDAIDDIGTRGGNSFRKLSDAGSEVSGELRQNLGETFSSFRGDLEDLPQIAQDTLGGLAGSGAIGGIAGLAATAAGAAGLGLIVGAIDNINAAAEKSEERASELAGAYIEAGTTVLSTIDAAARVSQVVTDKELREEATKLAETIGIDLAEAVRIVAGDANALAGAQGILADRQAVVNDKMNTGTELSAQRIIEIQEERRAVIDQSNALEVYSDRQDTATQRAQLYSDSLKAMIDDAGSATVEVDELGNKLYTLPDQTQVLINAETQQATTNVDGFKGDLDGVPETVTTRAQFDASAADRDLDNWIIRNNGRTIRIAGRFDVESGVPFE
ncbi:hypothetical protein SRABI98_03550 [Microbacterium sp. Bi98]|uniref:hypothetical protein n=1 Tax=Microbacterium sp. Bi98 TaxID=2821116 RepID=UPI001D2ABAD0|nr:hypothetical protein [Microbacterium sp. Bi98]CAH0262754.1 hypothetical protein SRABI98_03550 [Microbacterium sp. Bi98]